MTIFGYIKQVLRTYASGGKDYLDRTLDESLVEDEVIGEVEDLVVRIGTLLAGGRMEPNGLNTESEDALIQGVDHIVRKIDEFWPSPAPEGVYVPNKSELISIGIMSLVVIRLERGNERIGRLDPLVLKLPGKLEHLQQAFSEAHFNYLLGNRAAVAVMCRVLVESALRDHAPGEITIDGDTKTIDDRIEEAGEKGLLDGERRKCVREIIKLGNDAAHGNARFVGYRDEQIEKALLDTRKILEDLY